MRDNSLPWVRYWSQPHSVMTEDYERSAISRHLVYLSSTTRISFFWLQRFRRGGVSHAYNAVYTQHGRMQKKRKGPDGLRCWDPCWFTHRLPWEKSSSGRRASTLRSRVRAVRRYLNWLATNHGAGYPRELEHVTGYFQARQSEPCTRNALPGAHTAIAFMEEVAGVEPCPKKKETAWEDGARAAATRTHGLRSVSNPTFNGSASGH